MMKRSPSASSLNRLPPTPSPTPPSTSPSSTPSPISSQSSPILTASSSAPTPITAKRLSSEELQDRSVPLALSFSGCGFLGVYHLGVVHALLKQSSSLVARVERVAGTSAGSLVAALLVCCPDKLDEARDILYTLADEVNTLKFGALTPGFSIIRRLEELAATLLPELDGASAARIYVSITSMKTKLNKLVSQCEDKPDLIQHLLASCYIPVYAGINEELIKIKEEEFVDGGLSNNLPKFDDVRTITVSPFSGEAEISPTDSASFDWSMTIANQNMRVNLKNIIRGAQALFPPNRSVLERYHRMGIRDAMRWLLGHGLLERPEGSPV